MKRALVTGGAKRIGAAIVRALAADNWFVCIHCNQSQADAETLLADIRANGGDGLVVAADLSDNDRILGLVPICVEQAGPLTLLVNNASLFEYDRFETMTIDSWDAHHSVNLKAPAFLSQAFAAQLGGLEGQVVNLIDAKLGNLNPDYFSYTIPKLALKTLTEMMAVSHPANLRVNAIAPGLTAPSEKMSQQRFEELRKMNPLGRGVNEDDIVSALKFLISTPAVHGRVITVDAGHSLIGQERDIAFTRKE